MPKVMFTISYAIKPELRDRYLALIKELKFHLTTVGKKDYSVFEAKGQANTFTEVYVTGSIEEFDALEDNQDEKTEELIAQITECFNGKGTKYNTLTEAI